MLNNENYNIGANYGDLGGHMKTVNLKQVSHTQSISNKKFISYKVVDCGRAQQFLYKAHLH